MNDARPRSETMGHTIGAEIPYRRSTLEKRTGSLVFDRHLDQTLAEAPRSEQARRN